MIGETRIQAVIPSDLSKNHQNLLSDDLFEDLKKYYPRFPISRSNKSYRLYGILAVQVPGSVECERGFSVLNEGKTDLRNRLKGEHLEAAMRVALTPMTAETFNRKHRKTLVKT